MRVLAADLSRGPNEGMITVVRLDDGGTIDRLECFASPHELAAGLGGLVGDEPFLLGVPVPVVAPARGGKARTVDNLVRRRLGFRMPSGGRAALPGGVPGDGLLAALAAAGRPCLPYPDRERSRAGLAEIHPRLALKVILWEASPLASDSEGASQESLFRAYAPPAYRAADVTTRVGWAERASAVDLALRALEPVGWLDSSRARETLGRVADDDSCERAGAALDASIVAATAKRYLDAPESCLFLGDNEQGYVILPADGLVRRLALSGTAARRPRLFPAASLRKRLGDHARLRAGDLLAVPGRPQRIEAAFREEPRYEFDNRDEMLWWKHCRHLAGPRLPVEGLRELVVVLGDEADGSSLTLARSRHRTLSFRFEPPAIWRRRLPTRDGRTYPFRVLRAVYEARPDDV